MNKFTFFFFGDESTPPGEQCVWLLRFFTLLRSFEGTGALLEIKDRHQKKMRLAVKPSKFIHNEK